MALEAMKKGKSAGDGSTADILFHGRDIALTKLAALLAVPGDFIGAKGGEKREFSSNRQKADLTELKNYKPISQLSITFM